MNPRVRRVHPLPGHRLLLTFTNGEKGVFDCRPLLEFGVFRELQDEAYFRQARRGRNRGLAARTGYMPRHAVPGVGQVRRRNCRARRGRGRLGAAIVAPQEPYDEVRRSETPHSGGQPHHLDGDAGRTPRRPPRPRGGRSHVAAAGRMVGDRGPAVHAADGFTDAGGRGQGCRGPGIREAIDRSEDLLVQGPRPALQGPADRAIAPRSVFFVRLAILDDDSAGRRGAAAGGAAADGSLRGRLAQRAGVAGDRSQHLSRGQAPQSAAGGIEADQAASWNCWCRRCRG